MKDLKSQLADAFGVAVPEASPAAAPAAPAADSLPDILAPDAHLRDPWLVRLRQLVAREPSVKLAPAPKPGQARQATDQLMSKLKKSGRKREAAELKRLRDDFLGRRDKAAWGAVKGRFKTLGLSDKAYRGLKQGSVDPLVVLGRLKKADSAALAAMGAKRLRDHLTG